MSAFKKILLLCCLSWQFCSAAIASQFTADSSFIVNSNILAEQCKTIVYLPHGYHSAKDKYPVIYVLDGQYNSSFTADAVKILTESERMPPSIIIGIVSSNRERDFTPAGGTGWQPPREMASSGGANKFLDYIEKELIPYVEKNFRTEPMRVLVGHSLGGLLAMHSFSTRPALFKNYIALESSLWWDDGAIGNETIEFLGGHPDYKGKLFIGRIKIPREAWFPINITVVDYLEKQHPPGLDYTYMELENETHSTMVFPATYFGLRDIFSDYFFELNEKANSTTLTDYYTALSSKYGYTVKMPEQMYAFLWNMASHEKRYKDAINYGEKRIEKYPGSYRAYMDLGNTYVEANNKELAIKYLSKALELNPGDKSIQNSLKELSAKDK